MVIMHLPPLFCVFFFLLAHVCVGHELGASCQWPSELSLTDSKTMASDDTRKNSNEEQILMGKDGEEEADSCEEEWFRRQMSEASLCATEEEEEEEDKGAPQGLDLGPRISLKSEIEKDKDDESLRRWKEQLLGIVDLNSVGENLEPEVEILSLSILCSGRPDIVLSLPVEPNHKQHAWFTLKEGSHYKLKFTFVVRNNIVSGFSYTNTVWKAGIKVEKTKDMLGTFSPQLEAYTCETLEEITPSGLFARGSYSARMKFVDDDDKCYLAINYSFDIRREWALTN